MGAIRDALVSRLILWVVDDEIIREQLRPPADTPERRATFARVDALVARQIVKDDPKMGTTHPQLGICDNPDHSTIPNRGQWKRCDLCGHARLKGVR